jgi:hypothetical protein
MTRSRLSAFISLLVVFLSGALVGAVGNRLYMVSTVSSKGTQVPPRRMDPEEARKHLTAESRDRLKLDDEQVRKLDKIYDEERQEFDRMHQRWNAEGRTLRAQHAERIKAILRPDQIPLFDKLQAEREERRRLHEQQDRKK